MWQLQPVVQLSNQQFSLQPQRRVAVVQHRQTIELQQSCPANRLANDKIASWNRDFDGKFLTLMRLDSQSRDFQIEEGTMISSSSDKLIQAEAQRSFKERFQVFANDTLTDEAEADDFGDGW
eukprot:TRINITY_DN3003_c1_g1_i3.p2 TRINITY_DN3003_c1_g1~~TRINITY_DN3003_c1_g1_i3.p2  ORF type:complete len:122 (-),score=13.75 TRINITY_DN3003_c1_g1_i3:318-683(-)